MAFLLQQLLTESALRFPQKEALRFEGESLTYEQVDRLSNQIANSLLSAGLGRGERVGILVPKSPASVTGIFGILKAEGVYVPLETGAAKRLAYILNNCDIQILVTSSSLMNTVHTAIKEGTPLTTLIVTDGETPVSKPNGISQLMLWQDVLSQDDKTPPNRGTIETDLAYMIYTSGSTGEPKGVMISHRTIFTFINWCYDTFKITAEDRVTSHAPIHFDLSTFDIFVTIKAGGTLVLIPDKLSMFPIQLARLLQDERITVTYLVPSVLSMMVTYGKLADHDLSSLRIVLFAGEVFPIKYLRQLVAMIPNVDFFNLYGPTETNVCTYYQVEDKDLAPDITKPVPIGKACENIEVFAVDDDGGLVIDPGQEGELWVRGSCVAQGYWGDPDKTSRNFVPNLFETRFEELAYRTGDIVRLDEDGENWRFIGRRDHMIKSRGYRIELVEIEVALHAHEYVKEAAVVAFPDDLFGNRLKAFVVTLDGETLTKKELHTHCVAMLPAYMVPESILFADYLPKTSTGKVNRQLLAEQ